MHKMEYKDEIQTYIKALKSRSIRKVKIETSDRKKAFDGQKGKCAKCGKEINTLYCKYIQNPETKKYTVLCYSCAVPIPERK